MKAKEIRLLDAEEINVKPKQVIEKRGRKYVMVLLYKDSRCDMARLDEAFGPDNWQRHQEIVGDNLYCTVGVWDDDKKCWVEKQDVGTESDVEKVKGESSDAFKRACTNWGIGRELYTAPKVYIELEDHEVYRKDNSLRIDGKVAFHVDEIGYGNNREIVKLVIADSDNRKRFSWKDGRYIAPNEPKKKSPEKPADEEPGEFVTMAQAKNIMAECAMMGIDKYVIRALEDRGLKGLSCLKTSEIEEFVKEVELIAKEALG